MAYPNPTPEEIVAISEITLLDVETVAQMLVAESEAIANARWTKAQEYSEAWADVAAEDSDIEQIGSIRFFEGAAGDKRLAFRNKVRALYGFPALLGETSQAVSSGRSASKRINFGF